jgi:N-acetyl-anhydromuramyl-L-alanine amidase AmpD
MAVLIGLTARCAPIFLFGFLFCSSLMADSDFDETQATRFARLALDCIHKEYPNKIAHSLSSDADVKPPRELTPAFYGCYDWHSSVHGHWLLVRTIRLFPNAPIAADPRRKPLTALAARLREAGLESIRGEHYEGGHWLGSFALYLVSARGLR